jgi:hypothetical protein
VPIAVVDDVTATPPVPLTLELTPDVLAVFVAPVPVALVAALDVAGKRSSATPQAETATKVKSAAMALVRTRMFMF